MLKPLGLAVLLTISGAAVAQTTAETHAEMAGCESCHPDGSPTTELTFENEKCVECHGALNEFADETHQKHFEMIACSDCHVSHSEELPSDTCTNCH
ncbi:cytochrome c3 family protein [Shewanella sp. KX20019]|uniref:cytochrome c3 family protein n=1 Tax=Shewanella sp. KX20019 TaxID=2803864 RepID=UPI0019255984|nr:cytochrome c3 family protein [Shewanella sp. KX20019]QQX81665.1 cytochrome c3 family protein [Shewanella sp. KX20019]